MFKVNELPDAAKYQRIKQAFRAEGVARYVLLIERPDGGADVAFHLGTPAPYDDAQLDAAKKLLQALRDEIVELEQRKGEQ